MPVPAVKSYALGKSASYNLRCSAAYEALASKVAGTFSVGDEVTLADVCLVPATWSAARFGIDIQNYPTIARVVARMEDEDAVKKAHWRNQPDTPEEFRQD